MPTRPCQFQLLDMSSLELRELPEILDESAQFTWYTLGVYLKLSKGKLDDIEKRCKWCKIELFNLWMKTNHDASWEQLALALERCGKTVLADRIRTHYHHRPVLPNPSQQSQYMNHRLLYTINKQFSPVSSTQYNHSFHPNSTSTSKDSVGKRTGELNSSKA